MTLFTAEKEEYLKLIKEKQREKELVKNNELAKELDLARASVTEMFLKLSQEELIIYIPYKGVKLTEKGKHYVKLLEKKQELLLHFFEQHLACTKKEREDMLDHLEHINHELFFEKLEQYLFDN